MGFERPDAFIEKIVREQSSGNETFDARVIDQWEEQRPRVRDFSDVYSDQELERDEEYVRSREHEWKARPRKSMRLEYMMLDGIYSRNWLGENTEVYPASQFDDIREGIDIVVRFTLPDGSYQYLGIDVTTAELASVLREKVVRTTTDLGKGRSPRIKYYVGGDGEKRGMIYLPRVVIGTDVENVNALFSDFVSGLEQKTNMKIVNKHPIQLGIIRQMEKQLVLFTEASLGALLRESKKLGKSNLFERTKTLLAKVEPMSVGLELRTKEWEDLCEELRGLREEIAQFGRPGETLLSHIDLLQELKRIEKEKDSDGVISGGARGETEEFLENPSKELLRAA